MPSVLTTLGAATYNSFTSYGSGTDYVSIYDPYDDYASPVTGAIGDEVSRPIMFRYIQQYNSQTGSASTNLQITANSDGTTANGAGVVSPNIAGSDADPDWNWTDATSKLQFAAFAKDSANATKRYYYGFEKNDANTFYFQTGATTDSAANPNNVYRDGTVDTAYSGRVLHGRIGWYHVPNAPTAITGTATTSSSRSFSWTAPSDNGGLAINGYRIAYSTDGGANWTVYGGSTSGSPSGTTTESVTVSGLQSNTYHIFKIAALNQVSDRHGGVDAGAGVQANYTGTAAHTGTNATTSSLRTLLASPTVSGSFASVGNVNAAYSSSITFTQPKGGGASTAYTHTITTSSGSLPPNLSYSTSVTSDATNSYTTVTLSGTPTTPGVYTFTTTATNSDGNAVTTSSQTITITALSPLVYNGTENVRSSAKVWNGSSWITPEIKVSDGAGGWSYLK